MQRNQCPVPAAPPAANEAAPSMKPSVRGRDSNVTDCQVRIKQVAGIVRWTGLGCDDTGCKAHQTHTPHLITIHVPVDTSRATPEQSDGSRRRADPVIILEVFCEVRV